MRIQRLVQRGEFDTAKQLASKLTKSQQSSVGLKVLLADVLRESGNLSDAATWYENAKEALKGEEHVSSENRRFLNAYSNFHLTGIEFDRAGQRFASRREFAELINELEAEPRYKKVFTIPI
ncbi:hypothetical protein RXV86_15275 [Alisedimentitalea sp. MJ-SS2]|uniref:hypothetical protein n=1 Tax=Aliisedimentitalea sp. MJ-SS2 TaxID=3049795 RepID=UPI00290DEBE0|nr:hypothetical protein [Alisedimentitalea sp. MJ-SS2]MDU8928752.1 hypothetical protein [Alisedimentitalea sp. MJ-SS2]